MRNEDAEESTTTGTRQRTYGLTLRGVAAAAGRRERETRGDGERKKMTQEDDEEQEIMRKRARKSPDVQKKCKRSAAPSGR